MKYYNVNFKFPAQFGEELCEKRTQNMRKIDQKTIILGL